MERILFKNMTEETKRLVKENQIWASYPSGMAFQKFKSDEINTPDGIIVCDYEVIYDGDFPCDSVRKYYLKD